jgi:hypothetical protein
MTYYMISDRKYGFCQGVYLAATGFDALEMMAVEGGSESLADEAALDGLTVDQLRDEMTVEDIGWALELLAATVIATDLESGDRSAWTADQLVNVAHIAGVSRDYAYQIGTFGMKALTSAVFYMARRAA